VKLDAALYIDKGPDTMPLSTVILLDVDNTLLNNDQFAADLTAQLEQTFGDVESKRYWSIYETIRDSLGFADYLGALQQFRIGMDDSAGIIAMSTWFIDYPFASQMFPHVLEVIEHLKTLGRPVILSDGDAVFQPHKVVRAGLFEAFSGDVLIYVHKELALPAMQHRYPADHYVMIDDKPNLLAAMKRVLGDRLTTVFVRQGHYALQADMSAIQPPPDRTISRIGDLLGERIDTFYPKGHERLSGSSEP
jgi:FMN phosphatase YigB (HAD superfamily)